MTGIKEKILENLIRKFEQSKEKIDDILETYEVNGEDQPLITIYSLKIPKIEKELVKGDGIYYVGNDLVYISPLNQNESSDLEENLEDIGDEDLSEELMEKIMMANQRRGIYSAAPEIILDAYNLFLDKEITQGEALRKATKALDDHYKMYKHS